MAKVHLLDCSEPIREGMDVRVNCGLVLPKARAIAIVDWTEYGAHLSVTRDVCRNCLKVLGARDESVPRYSYALVSGQESREAA